MEIARRCGEWVRQRASGEYPWMLAVAGFVLANMVWLHFDRLPPAWDQSAYLDGGEVLYRALTQGGLLGLLKALTIVNGAKAPLLSLLPLPLYLVFGHTYHVALGVNLVLMAVSSYYVYHLAERFRSRRAGVLAVVILNLFPLVAGLSREFLVETCLMALVLAWHKHLLDSVHYRARGTWLRLGVVLGLGMLVKILFPLYIVGASLWVLWLRIREDRGVRVKLVATLGGLLASGAVVAAVWYARNLRNALATAANSGYGAVASSYGSRSVFAWQTLSSYWLRVASDVVSPVLTLTLVLTALWAFATVVRGRRGLVFHEGEHLWFLLAWLIVPFVVLSLGVNKDIRFLLPVLPALALLGACGLDALAELRRSAWIAIAVLLGLACGVYAVRSFVAPTAVSSTPTTARTLAFGGVGGYMRAPVAQEWPLAEIDRSIEADAARSGIAEPGVTLLFDQAQINVNNLQYMRTLAGGTATYRTSAYVTPLTDAAGERVVLGLSDYVVTKSGDVGPDFTNVLNRRIAAHVEAGRLAYDELGRAGLPDGSRLVVYRRRR